MKFWKEAIKTFFWIFLSMGMLKYARVNNMVNMGFVAGLSLMLCITPIDNMYKINNKDKLRRKKK